MTEEELKVNDDMVKKNARKQYNREEHKHFVINKYFVDAIENEKIVEKCLRINEAKNLLMKYKYSIDGNQKIILLNSIV